MKVRAGDIEAFCRKPGAETRAVLVYGPDDGLVRERARHLVGSVVADPGDPFLVAEMNGDAIAGDPARLFDEAASISLTGGRRVVWVRDAVDGAAGVLADFLAQPAGDSLIVLQAGELSKRSALRKLFESADNGAAVACYADEARDIDRLIDETFSTENLTATAEARAWLAGSLGSDRGVTRSELAKLATYAGPGGTVTLDDARACIGDNALRTLDDVAMAAAGGDRVALDRALSASLDEGVQPIRLLRAVAGHLLRLQWAAARMAGGRSAESAIQGLRPPVFFKNKSRFLDQTRRWPPASLGRALEIVLEAERQCKRTGTPDQSVCGRALLQVAALARKSGR